MTQHSGWTRAGQRLFCAAATSMIVPLVAVIGGCVSSEPPRPVASASKPDSTLGPGDTFEVSVYGEADLSGKHQIAEDGTIRFPLVGRIEAAGKGPVEIADTRSERRLPRDRFCAIHTSRCFCSIRAPSKCR